MIYKRLIEAPAMPATSRAYAAAAFYAYALTLSDSRQPPPRYCAADATCYAIFFALMFYGGCFFF